MCCAAAASRRVRANGVLHRGKTAGIAESKPAPQPAAAVN
jgi:hypothetical protein